jgi:DNA recombination protein RmuC
MMPIVTPDGIPSSSLLFLAAGFLLALAVLIPFLLLAGRKKSAAPLESPLLQESFHRIESLSRQIEDLGRIFIVPRTRGGVGETMLEQLLQNWLPAGAWRRQYSFSDGGRVDAVVRAGSSIVAIDAKFPLEQVAHLLEKGLDESSRKIPAAERKIFVRYGREISEKYIRPEEGTLPFALLYIPSEHLYYRCFVEDPELAGELASFHVIPASPSTLFLYLQTVAYGLKGLALPRKAEELRSHMQRIKSETERLERLLSTTAHHLKNLQSSFDDSRTALIRLSTTTGRLLQEREDEENS